MTTEMTIYCGFKRDTEVVLPVRPLDCGAGEIECLECFGAGWWAFGPPGTEGPCVVCKGTGRQLVSAP